ncbi:aminodeoxyfutalosine synthase [Dissulfurispira thermophila]|uniref:Aminodeoxyfutalosine synthase n=2 Tax=root TaxID=1 RepID=A0A7G1GZR2_9BACT|nr:aminofutalosine synthase MqnE [Dissulfurispira thermophila]BCB95371.1 aminodeoxyfutalosine synthase [Dissulfurispira thermophila]
MLGLIKDKVLSGQRLVEKDAIRLFQSDDIFTIGRLASYVAEKKNNKNAYFIINRHVNPTNICINRCKFCAFSRSKGEEGAYELTIEEIIEKLKDGHGSQVTGHGFSEVHIVGGLHPDWHFEYYLDMLSSIKKEFPHIAIKAFTAVEVDYMSKISGLSLEETLIALKKNGLDLMPGGGAEIFSEGVRNKLCPEKISGDRWLEVMEIAHRVGIKTNATMLYGHLEGIEDRVKHLLKLRDLQDKTGGFQAFIPLAYHPKNTEIGGFYSSGIDDLKTIAISRLVLDNFDHIKAYWIMLGEKISQVALLFGADDVDGTIIEEKITHSAGAMSEEGMTREELIYLIKKAGKVPVQRDAFYNPIDRGLM